LPRRCLRDATLQAAPKPSSAAEISAAIRQREY
jgi:hypothetical protein